MIDPAVELLQAMAECGLHPKDIQWDDGFRRFPGIGQSGRGDNGWVQAFADERGAIFGDNRTKEQWKWPGDNSEWKARMKHHKPPPADEVELRRRKAKYSRAEESSKATENIIDTWYRAKPCPNHPYLEAKGIRDVKVLQSIIDPETQEEVLLIPMRNAEKELRNIQRIWPDGTRKQMWQPGGSAGLYDTIGAHRFGETKTLYICEGWATGWTIHMATNCAVIVAFFDGGLRVVGEAIQKKLPEAEIIIAADNDRWKLVKRDGEMVNPGVHAARTAAEELGVESCVPDFSDLETEPTDYDDLRQLEGLDAVRKWLDPKMAAKAVTEVPQDPEPEPAAEDPAEEEEREQHWTKTFPARLLGGVEDTFYFLPLDTCQLFSYPAGKLGNSFNLIMLAPLKWYEKHFAAKSPHGGGVDWQSAGMAIIRESMQAGYFQRRNLRGLGCWIEDDKPVLNLGDRLYLPHGETIALSQYIGDNAYLSHDPPYFTTQATEPLSQAAAQRILDLLETILWEREASAFALAGWLVLAPFCAILPLRPHVCLTGPSGSGASTVLSDIVCRLLGGMAYRPEATLSKRSLLEGLKSHRVPILIEDWTISEKTRSPRRNLVDLMRWAGSKRGESSAYFGTASGKPRSYQLQSMFCLAGDNFRLAQAERARIALLKLRHPAALGCASLNYWDAIDRKIAEAIQPETAHGLLCRTFEWIHSGEFDALRDTCQQAAWTILEDRQAADQYGTLFAGAYTLTSDRQPDEATIRDWMETLDLAEYAAEAIPQGHHVLKTLLGMEEMITTDDRTLSVTIGELVGIVFRGAAANTPACGVSYKAARLRLREIGILRKGPYLHLANQSERIRGLLHGTPFSDGWMPPLRRLPGTKAGEPQHFAGFRSRTTKIPVDLLEQYLAEPLAARTGTRKTDGSDCSASQ